MELIIVLNVGKKKKKKKKTIKNKAMIKLILVLNRLYMYMHHSGSMVKTFDGTEDRFEGKIVNMYIRKHPGDVVFLMTFS